MTIVSMFGKIYVHQNSSMETMHPATASRELANTDEAGLPPVPVPVPVLEVGVISPPAPRFMEVLELPD
jgi:hypothetical protein